MNGSAFDVKMLAIFGLLGYLFKKLDFPLAPVALTFILGPLMELAMRQSLIMAQGNMAVFITRPISGGLLLLAALVLLSSAFRIPAFWHQRHPRRRLPDLESLPGPWQRCRVEPARVRADAKGRQPFTRR